MEDRRVDTVQPPRVTSGGEPPPDTSSESDAQPASTGPKPKRGELRIYLGAAPGVGKTFAMLGEAHIGFLFCAPENVRKQFPQFKAVEAYVDLMRLIRAAMD